jgi:hypothetical protein
LIKHWKSRKKKYPRAPILFAIVSLNRRSEGEKHALAEHGRPLQIVRIWQKYTMLGHWPSGKSPGILAASKPINLTGQLSRSIGEQKGRGTYQIMIINHIYHRSGKSKVS